MAKATYLSQPTILRIPVLLQEIRDRIVVIPRFQRPFVWIDQQRLELMESIYSGIPIGSLLVWRTREHDLETYRLRGTKDRKHKPEDGQYQYLLDGHQRVITLFTGLGNGHVGGEEDDKTPLINEEDDYDVVRPIYFDLETKEFVLGRESRREQPMWFPLRDLFDDYQLYEFQKRLGEGDRAQKSMVRLRNLHKAFYDYSIAVVPIMTDDLDVATKGFKRVNSAGTSMSEVHMVNALTYIKGFHLNQRIEEICEELGEVGWQDIEPQTILDICKARLDLPVHLKSVTELVKRLRKEPSLLDSAKDALILAAKFLARACDIHGPKTLPYSYQVVLLADVLSAHDQDPAGLDGVLATWLWVTTYSEYFASMNATRLRSALEHLRNVAAGTAEPPPKDLPREISPPRRFDFRAARSRAIALLMAGCHPVSPRGTRYKAHEILAKHGRDAAPKLLSSTQIGRSESESFENRIIALPRDVNALRNALLQKGRLKAAAMRSHGITPAAARALWKGDYSEFLRLRRSYFLDKERKFVEKELGLSYAVEP